MKLGMIAWSALAATVTLVACGGGGGGPGNPPPSFPAVIRSFTFPAGNATASPGTTAWDIVGVTTTLTDQFHSSDAYDTLRVDVTFVQDISDALPAPGQQLSSAGTELGVQVALDTDGNPATGVYSGCDPTDPLRPFEYGSDQGNDPSRLADGNYSIIDPQGGPIYQGAPNPPAEAQTSVAGHVFSQTFFLPTVGILDGAAAPKIGIAVASFNGASGSPTDCMPAGSALELFTN